MFDNFPTPTDIKTQNFLKGVKLILKYQPSAKIQTWQDDTISLGRYDTEQMTKEEVKSMNEWGWYGHNYSWRIWI